MKAVMMMYDSLNRRYLPPYGQLDWIKAPNFTRLAEHTVTFDRCFVGSLPCMPARRELHTGRYNFLHRSWGPLEPYDDSMPEILRENGVYTHLISDHQHYWEDGGATYHHRYCTWENVRGQEGDRWKGIVDPEAHGITLSPKQSNALAIQDAINRSYMDTEDKMPQPQTVAGGLHFLEQNWQADNWFLQIETFDPHEPFFTKNRFKELYPDEYDGEDYDWPGFSSAGDTPEQVAHLQKEYAALISMCDEYLGKVLDFMDSHDMWKDTLFILCTDHGYMLGERGVYGKGSYPSYNEYANMPLFLWDPRAGVKGEHRKSVAQMIDIPPTLLDFFGAPIPKDMMGRSLLPVLREDVPQRKGGLYGGFGGHITVTDGRYVYMHTPPADRHDAPMYEYLQMPTHMRNLYLVDELKGAELAEPFSFTKGTPLFKLNRGGGMGGMKNISSRPSKPGDPGLFDFSKLAKLMANRPQPTEDYLFDLDADPDELHPIPLDSAPEIVERMKKLMVELMVENDTPKEQYHRLGLEQYL